MSVELICDLSLLMAIVSSGILFIVVKAITQHRLQLRRVVTLTFDRATLLEYCR